MKHWFQVNKGVLYLINGGLFLLSACVGFIFPLLAIILVCIFAANLAILLAIDFYTYNSLMKDQIKNLR